MDTLLNALVPVIALMLPTERSVDQSAVLLSDSACALLSASIPNHGPAWAIGIYGSLVRGTGTTNSDVDVLLLLLSQSFSDEIFACESAEQIRSLPRVSIGSFDLMVEIDKWPPTLRQISILKNILFIRGNADIFRMAKTLYWEYLLRMDLDSMLTLWHGDPYRSYADHLCLPQTYRGLKRGRGGLIDLDFESILADWALIHNFQLNKRLMKRHTLRLRLTRALAAARLLIIESRHTLRDRARVALLVPVLRAIAMLHRFSLEQVVASTIHHMER